MIIKQVLNNNVVMAFDDKDEEVVVVGTGIGFHAKKGDKIDSNKIQQVFVCRDNKMLIDIIQQISSKMLETCEKIRKYAQDYLDIKIDDEVFLLLTDHINFAVKRLKDNLELDNPFLHEIKQFFTKEYEVGLYAQKVIMENYGIKIPEAEVGYISMHLISSQFHINKSSVNKVFDIIDMSVNYIKENYLGNISSQSLAYTRLVTHIKYFAQRYIDDKESKNDDELLSMTINEIFKEEVECIDGLSNLLLERFGKEVTQSEKNYIILHLRNCKNIS